MLKHYLFVIAICVSTICCKKEIACKDCVSENRSPIANAGPDQTIQLPATWVSIDGSKSIDPNNKPLTYKWRKVSGPDHVQYYSSFFQSPQPSQIEMDLYGGGDYLFELTVTNSVGLSATDMVKITITRAPETAHPID